MGGNRRASRLRTGFGVWVSLWTLVPVTGGDRSSSQWRRGIRRAAGCCSPLVCWRLWLCWLPLTFSRCAFARCLCVLLCRISSVFNNLLWLSLLKPLCLNTTKVTAANTAPAVIPASSKSDSWASGGETRTALWRSGDVELRVCVWVCVAGYLTIGRACFFH